MNCKELKVPGSGARKETKFSQEERKPHTSVYSIYCDRFKPHNPIHSEEPHGINVILNNAQTQLGLSASPLQTFPETGPI